METARQVGAAGFAVVVLDVDGAAVEETAAVVAAEHDIAVLGAGADIERDRVVDEFESAGAVVGVDGLGGDGAH